VGTNELRQMLGVLNTPPFSMALNLVTLDEKNPLELIEIINVIFAFLDDAKKMDLKKESADSIAKSLTDFLKVLDYPIENETLFIN